MLMLKLQYSGHLDAKSQLIQKDPDAGKDWGQEKKGQQRVGWLDGITDSMDTSWSKLGDGEGQGRLACCSSRGHKESDTTEQLNNNHFVKPTDCWQFKCAFPNWKCIWFLTWQPRTSPFQTYLLSNCCVQRKHCTRPQERCVWLSSPKSITQGYSQIFLENFSQTRHIHLTSTESKIWIRNVGKSFAGDSSLILLQNQYLFSKGIDGRQEKWNLR